MLLQRVQEIPESMARSLNLYVIYGALPALILVQIPTIGLSFELLVPVLMPWFLLICGVLLIGLGWKLFGWPSATVGCLLLCVPLGNTSFLGIPMVTAFFGEEQVPYAIIYDQLGSFIALSTYGAVVLAGFQHGKIPGVMPILRKIVTFPPFIALCLAFMLQPVSFPQPITTALTMIGSSLVPVVMVAVGLQLKVRMAGSTLQPFIYGLTVKLLVAPLLALAACRMLQLSGDAATIAVFESGMPPMVTAGALAMAADLKPELAAALVGWGIVLSFITLSGLYFLL
jgi:predicted permease